MKNGNGLGWITLMRALMDDDQNSASIPPGIKIHVGRVGTMKVNDVIGSLITVARREAIIDDSYRAEHALYAAIKDALQGVCRGGSISLGEVLRTTSLRFAIARGQGVEFENGDWVAVAMYGTIGSPVKGHEHEAAGLGMAPI